MSISPQAELEDVGWTRMYETPGGSGEIWERGGTYIVLIDGERYGFSHVRFDDAYAELVKLRLAEWKYLQVEGYDIWYHPRIGYEVNAPRVDPGPYPTLDDAKAAMRAAGVAGWRERAWAGRWAVKSHPQRGIRIYDEFASRFEAQTYDTVADAVRVLESRKGEVGWREPVEYCD